MLETKRLLLRNFKETDLDDFFEFTSNKKIQDMSGWYYFDDKFSTGILLKKEMKKPYQFAIELKGENKVVGLIELKDCTEESARYYRNIDIVDGAKEIMFLLSENYWGKGIMPEAIERVLEFAFNELDVPQVLAGYYKENVQSKKIQERLGFNSVGQVEIYRPIVDRKTTFTQSIMTKEDYIKTRKGL